LQKSSSKKVRSTVAPVSFQPQDYNQNAELMYGHMHPQAYGQFAQQPSQQFMPPTRPPRPEELQYWQQAQQQEDHNAW
jgi:hypothetical protein